MNELSKELQNLLIEYGAYLSAERGLSKNTVDSYLRDIRKFLAVLQEKQNGDITALNDDQIRIIFTELSSGISQKTLSRYISSVRGFIKYLTNEKRILNDVQVDLKNPKIKQTLPAVLSVEDVNILLATPDIGKINGARDKAILEVLYATGMRVTELTTLKMDQLFLQEGYIRVIGKGNKERIVPIGLPAVEALSYYLHFVRSKCKQATQTSVVFLSNRGGALSRQTVWRIIQKYAKESGLSERTSLYPHILRHSFASHLLAGGADLRLIQELLGHSDISTTQIYTHLADEETLSMYHSSHPRSGMGKKERSDL